jgi:hypothetical protein
MKLIHNEQQRRKDMNPIKQLFNKNTTHGRTIRTFLQAVIGSTGFVIALFLIPGLSEFLSNNLGVSIATLSTFVAVVTLIQNSVEKLIVFIKNNE